MHDALIQCEEEHQYERYQLQEQFVAGRNAKDVNLFVLNALVDLVVCKVDLIIDCA